MALDQEFNLNKCFQEELNSSKLETALQQSQERLQLAMEGGALVWWDWHLATGQTYLAPQWQKMLGYEVDEIGDDYQSWAQLIHPEDVSKRVEALNAYLEGHISIYQVEFRMRSHSGEWKWIVTRGKVFERDEGGAPLRMLGVHEDISDRKLAEELLRQSEARAQEKTTELELALEELKRTQTRLIQAEDMSSLGVMVAGVAQDISNPISFIYSNLDYMHIYFQDLLRLIEIYKKTYPNSTSEIQELMSDIDLEFLVEDLPKLIDRTRMGTRRIDDIFRLLRGWIDAVLPENEQQIIADILAPYQQRGIQFHAIRTQVVRKPVAGTRRFLTFHVLVPGEWSVQCGHDLCQEIELAISSVLPTTYVTTHLHPSR